MQGFRQARRAGVIGGLALALFSLAGCGSDDGSSGPTPTATTDQSQSTSTPPTESSPPPSSPSVTPASGPLLSTDHVSLRAPKGFTVDTKVTFQPHANAPGGSEDTVYLGDLPYLHSDVTLKDVARNSLKNDFFGKTGRILPNVDISGVTMTHVVGRDITDNEQFDAILPGHQGVTIRFELDTEDTKAHQQQLIASVLASVEWKS